jgi:hypothetical protein
MIENLRYRLRHRNADLVSELFLDSATDLHDIAEYAHAVGPDDACPSAAARLASATDNLVSLLRVGSPRDELARAEQTYACEIDQSVVQPLLDWAMETDQPIVRNLGVELAELLRIMHAMRPRVQALLIAADSTATDGSARALNDYLSLARRVSQLLRDLRTWQRWCG